MNLLDHTSSLVAFVRSVEAGSFSAAARLAGTTPSAVSKGIRRLEAELGVKLFRRSTRQLSTTAEGRTLFERVAPLLRQLDDAGTAIGEAGEVIGILRASMPGELGRLLMTPIASTFLPRHAGLELDLSLTDNHVDIIRDGYDVVFRVGMLKDSDLKSRTLAKLPMALVGSPALLARHGVPATVEAMRAYPFVRYLMRGRALPISFADGTTIEPRGPVGADTGAALRAAALGGVGAAHLMKCTVQADLDAGTLVELPTPAALPALPLQAVHAFGEYPPARVKSFTDFIAEAVTQLM